MLSHKTGIAQDWFYEKLDDITYQQADLIRLFISLCGKLKKHGNLLKLYKEMFFHMHKRPNMITYGSSSSSNSIGGGYECCSSSSNISIGGGVVETWQNTQCKHVVVIKQASNDHTMILKFNDLVRYCQKYTVGPIVDLIYHMLPNESTTYNMLLLNENMGFSVNSVMITKLEQDMLHQLRKDYDETVAAAAAKDVTKKIFIVWETNELTLYYIGDAYFFLCCQLQYDTVDHFYINYGLCIKNSCMEIFNHPIIFKKTPHYLYCHSFYINDDDAAAAAVVAHTTTTQQQEHQTSEMQQKQQLPLLIPPTVTITPPSPTSPPILELEPTTSNQPKKTTTKQDNPNKEQSFIQIIEQFKVNCKKYVNKKTSNAIVAMYSQLFMTTAQMENILVQPYNCFRTLDIFIKNNKKRKYLSFTNLKLKAFYNKCIEIKIERKILNIISIAMKSYRHNSVTHYINSVLITIGNVEQQQQLSSSSSSSSSLGTATTTTTTGDYNNNSSNSSSCSSNFEVDDHQTAASTNIKQTTTAAEQYRDENLVYILLHTNIYKLFLIQNLGLFMSFLEEYDSTSNYYVNYGLYLSEDHIMPSKNIIEKCSTRIFDYHSFQVLNKQLKKSLKKNE